MLRAAATARLVSRFTARCWATPLTELEKIRSATRSTAMPIVSSTKVKPRRPRPGSERGSRAMGACERGGASPLAGERPSWLMAVGAFVQEGGLDRGGGGTAPAAWGGEGRVLRSGRRVRRGAPCGLALG